MANNILFWYFILLEVVIAPLSLFTKKQKTFKGGFDIFC
jgi:hypothetical protein